MDDASELLHAIAAVAWPTIVLVLFLVYRPQVIRLLGRLRRGKLFGQEVEFDLDQLESSASAAQDRIEAGPPIAIEAKQPELPAPRANGGVGARRGLGVREETLTARQPMVTHFPAEQTFDPEEEVLNATAISPRFGLVSLSAELEKTMRRILASSEPPDSWERRSIPFMVTRIKLPDSVRRAVTQFYEVRNRLVHGHDVSNDDIVRAIDSGLKILRALQSIPPAQRVRFPTVEVFADAEGTQPREIRAVVLDLTTGTGDSQRGVYPTRRSYKEGQVLTWEWDFSNVWGESWYRDPETDEVKYAWTEAAEFAGRPADELA